MRQKIAIVGAAAVTWALLLVAPSAASAMAPERTAFSFSNPGITDCGTFEDQFTDFFDAQAATYFGSAGNPIRFVIHWSITRTTPTRSPG